jgi:hypothetical protein
MACHIATYSPSGLLVCTDTVHILCVDAWLGGLAMLLLALPAAARPLPRRARPGHRLRACVRADRRRRHPLVAGPGRFPPPGGRGGRHMGPRPGREHELGAALRGSIARPSDLAPPFAWLRASRRSSPRRPEWTRTSRDQRRRPRVRNC